MQLRGSAQRRGSARWRGSAQRRGSAAWLSAAARQVFDSSSAARQCGGRAVERLYQHQPRGRCAWTRRQHGGVLRRRSATRVSVASRQLCTSRCSSTGRAAARCQLGAEQAAGRVTILRLPY